MADYVVELQHLSELLHDRLVSGVEEAKIQRQLLAEADLTFDKAFELAIAAECADKMPKIYSSRHQRLP